MNVTAKELDLPGGAGATARLAEVFQQTGLADLSRTGQQQGRELAGRLAPGSFQRPGTVRYIAAIIHTDCIIAAGGSLVNWGAVPVPRDLVCQTSEP